MKDRSRLLLLEEEEEEEEELVEGICRVDEYYWLVLLE